MDKNNTKTSIKKDKKNQDGGYKSSRLIRPLHPGLTFNDSYPIYPRYSQDSSSSYPYYSSILSRPAVNQPVQKITTRINVEMDVETLDDLIHLGKKSEPNSSWNRTLSIILI